MSASQTWFGRQPAKLSGVDAIDCEDCRTSLLAACDNAGASKLHSAVSNENNFSDFLCSLMALSPFMRGMLLRFPNELEMLFETPLRSRIEQLIHGAHSLFDHKEELSETELMSALRNIKSEAHMLIGLGDIAQSLTTEETTVYLSQLAQACLASAMDWLLFDAHQSGKVILANPANPSHQSGIIVLGMGKLGAYELNYSSDIDIIVYIDLSAPGLRYAEGKDPTEIMSRLVRRLVRIMQERTGDGYVFRTDLRLRPDPGATPLAISIEAALVYYESRGQNWERAAFIKARPVAGDLAAGASFLAELGPFIWRKYLDYAAISDVQSIKRQIHAHRGHGKIAIHGHNVKLGRGGIREIEFFVQTQQLIAGGRAPQLRDRQTIKMLGLLAAAGWIGENARDELTSAYYFLRRTEHAIQMVSDEQLHTLPKTDEELGVIAGLLGFESIHELTTALMEKFLHVERHFGDLFEDSDSLSAESGNLVFTGDDPDPDTLENLSVMGFQRTADMWKIVRTWHFGRYRALQSEKAREQLTAMLPPLLESFAKSGQGDDALLRFDALLAGLPTGVQLFSMLNSNRQLLSLLTRILSSAPRLADIITKRPLIFDGLLDPAFFERLPKSDELQERLDVFVCEADSYEDFLDRLRIFAAEQRFLVGVRLLTGNIDAETMGQALSHLADMLLSKALDAAASEVEQKHGTIASGRMSLLAMGRLGSCEMTASSDVDLLLIYDADPNAESDGERPLAASQYYARITQRLIAALSAPTAEGVLYEVDFRLRPSGNKGPLATSFASFSKYQREEAWTWEQMALTRARTICGDASLRAKVEDERLAVLSLPRDIQKTSNDIADMRQRLAKEKPAKSVWDLKQAIGGITDIEFLAQYWVLAVLPNCNTKLPNRKLNTRSARDILHLLDEESLGANDQDILIRALDDFTLVNQLIRLCVADEFDPDTATIGLMEQLCAALDLPNIASLEAHLVQQQQQVAEIFSRVIASH
ncbi:MAG: bifunctional [glutamine synthetase] adenylyltransferase/[glutamine synthetase]-adenylyl-L-tyrosine phosphorylase [Pseudomonadota bacterium]